MVTLTCLNAQAALIAMKEVAKDGCSDNAG